MTAQILVRDYNGLLPPTRKELEDLPGMANILRSHFKFARHEMRPFSMEFNSHLFKIRNDSFFTRSKSSSVFYWNLAREWSSSKTPSY
jgi:hypothetical protein